MPDLGQNAMTPERIFENLHRLDEIKKSATSVVGPELVRQDLEPTLRMAGNTATPLRNRFTRIPGEGNAHAYYVLTSNTGATTPGAKFFGTDPTGGAFAKGGLPQGQDPNYSLIARPYANIGDVLSVAWQDMAQGRSYIDIKQQQKMVKMMNAGLIEEYVIINGDADATGGLQFDGLIQQIRKGGYNVLDASAGGGSPLKFSLIEQLCFLIQKAGGLVRALIMSYAVKQAITQLISVALYGIRQTQMVSDGKVAGGIEISSWNFGTGSVDLITDMYMLPDPVTGLERIIFIDDETDDPKNVGKPIQLVDVDPMHYAELANIATADRGVVYETTLLQLSIPQFSGLLAGLNLSLPPSVN